MKRFVAVFIMLLLLTLPAYAGIGNILGKAGGFLEDKAIEYLIVAALTALGAFGLSYKLWGIAAKELAETIWKIVKAIKQDSPGGKQITAEEMQAIIDEAVDIYPAVSAAIASHKKADSN